MKNINYKFGNIKKKISIAWKSIFFNNLVKICKSLGNYKYLVSVKRYFTADAQ